MSTNVRFLPAGEAILLAEVFGQPLRIEEAWARPPAPIKVVRPDFTRTLRKAKGASKSSRGARPAERGAATQPCVGAAPDPRDIFECPKCRDAAAALGIPPGTPCAHCRP